MKENPPHKVNGQTRVVLFSKYELERESLKCLIEINKDIAVVGRYDCLAPTALDVDFPEADIVVINFSCGDAVEIIAKVRAKLAPARVVVIFDGLDLAAQAEVINHGAVGIVQKEHSPRHLISAIRRTRKGETWLNQALLSSILDGTRAKAASTADGRDKSATEAITPRELDVITHIGEGLKNKEIAQRMRISEATVRHHLSSIYGKIGVDDRLNLVIFAYRKGLLSVLDERTSDRS